MADLIQKHKRSTALLDFNAELARSVINSLSAHIAIIDKTGMILETNHAWREFAVRNGMPPAEKHKGLNYLSVCDAARGSDADDARNVAQGIRAVIDGALEEFLFDYPCHSPRGQHWYYMRAIRMVGGSPVRVIVSHEDITSLKLTEEALRQSEEDLKNQKQSLEETNIALKVLLKQRENDKQELEKRFLDNIKKLVLPYVEKLKHSPLKSREKTLIDIIGGHLNDIISPLLQNMAHAEALLTPQEISVAALIKDGRSSKEIADILNVSEYTVNFHRKNLRRKFGLKNKQANLRSYLMSISK